MSGHQSGFKDHSGQAIVVKNRISILTAERKSYGLFYLSDLGTSLVSTQLRQLKSV